MKSIDLVEQFHKIYNRPINESPVVHNHSLNKLRIRLLREELIELEDALMHENKVEVLDALTDLQYILDGTYLSFGFGSVKDAAFIEIHRSNMTKLDEEGKPIIREDGKILKGPNYQPPDLTDLVC